MKGLQIIPDVPELREQLVKVRSAGLKIALVPTLGALHEGHLSLIRLAVEQADVVVVSLFLNPSQFSENEDLAAYPSTFEQDCSNAEKAGADIVFCPKSSVMYGPMHSVWIDEDNVSLTLCGPDRPGHFRGVLTIVAKLFNIVDPDISVFGEKDAQQLALIRKMVADLDYDIRIVSGKTIRESDGLALSSRNVYLSKNERLRAASISRALGRGEDAVKNGLTEPDEIIALVRSEIEIEADDHIDYISLIDADTFKPLSCLHSEALLAVAVRIGKTRLIDNIRLVHTSP